MCRCTNRLDSSAVVVPGCLRGRGKHNNKGHQLHAVEHQCTGGTILEWNILQSSSEEVWRHHFSVQLICEGIQRRLPPGGAQDCFEDTLTSSLRRVLGGDPVRGVVWFVKTENAVSTKSSVFWGQGNRARDAFHIWGRAPCSSCIWWVHCMIDRSERGAESLTFLSCGRFPWRILLHLCSEICVCHPSAFRFRCDRCSAVLEADDVAVRSQMSGNCRAEIRKTFDGLSDGFSCVCMCGGFSVSRMSLSCRLVWLIKYLCCISEQECGL